MGRTISEEYLVKYFDGGSRKLRVNPELDFHTTAEVIEAIKQAPTVGNTTSPEKPLVVSVAPRDQWLEPAIHFECPVCRAWLMPKNSKVFEPNLFCSRCGQAIDWSDE